jgi:hypothetical protein
VRKSILIVGDAHAKPGVSNERFSWLADYAYAKKADIIVDMGDWADMQSLSSYDIGKKSYEGRRYIKDIEAAVEAREVFDHRLKELNKATKRGARFHYSPQKISLGGNHCEGRISRVIEDDPKLDGLIGLRDLEYDKYGWQYTPYRVPVSIQGFSFCHYFASGVMGRPIGGEVPALSLLRKQFTSCVAGHSHLWDVAHRTRPDGKRVWGICAGCYLAQDQWEDYAGEANKLWWRGLTLLKGAEDGDFLSMETISIGELKDKYGVRARGR